MLDQRREMKRLLNGSSLAPDQLWIDCPEHGKQARDPHHGGCILCPLRGRKTRQ